MREYFEKLEDVHLEPYAIKSSATLGRTIEEPESITRTCFQRDRDRIIHSKAFRRLKDKTQVFISNLSDHYRSRLTHTIEVSQISRHLARLLRLNEDVSECIALAHDLGHSPFGHSGEEELDVLLTDDGGFEHNLHSLRIVEEIEQKYPAFSGLNLSYEVKEGLKKHITPWDNPSTSNSFNSLETQIANLSDEIAYNNHDIDDGLASGILNLTELIKEVEIFNRANASISQSYSSLQLHERHHLINSYIISNQVINVYETSRKAIQQSGIQSLDDLQTISTPLIAFDSSMEDQNKQLRDYLFSHFYRSPSIQELNNYGKSTIRSIFNFLLSKPSFVPDSFFQLHQRHGYSAQQMIAYYIAGMTDNYASRFCKIHGLT